MRKESENERVCVFFANGLSVKGSFKHSMRGCYIDLYIMDNRGYVLASKNFSIKGTVFIAHVALCDRIRIVADVISRYKLDTVLDPACLERVAPMILLSAFPRSA